MLDRPDMDATLMEMAHVLAKRSPDDKCKVGAIIATMTGKLVRGGGYNGGARGLENERFSDRPGQSGLLHAEVNALLNSSLNPAVGHVMFVTHEPCYNCATAIINSGNINVVVFETPHYPAAEIDPALVDINAVAGTTRLHKAGIAVFWFGVLEGETAPRAHRIEYFKETSTDSRSRLGIQTEIRLKDGRPIPEADHSGAAGEASGTRRRNRRRKPRKGPGRGM